MSVSSDQRVHEFDNGALLPYQFVTLAGAIDEGQEKLNPPSLYIHGYAEGDKSTEAVLRTALEGAGVALTGIKIDFSDLTKVHAFKNRRHAVESVGREVIPAIMEEFSSEYSTEPTTVGHSMGSLMLGLGLEETKGEYTGDVLSVNGMGLTVNRNTGKVYRNRTAFLAHYVHALGAGTNPFRERLAPHATASAVKTIGKDTFKTGTFPAQLTMANETDALPAYYQHAQRGNRVLLLSGDEDKLFRTTQLQANLALYDLIDSNGWVPESLALQIEPGLGHQDAGMSTTSQAITHGLLALKSQ